MRFVSTWLVTSLVLGCASSASETSKPVQATGGAEAESLAGRWTEYWSVAGDAATEQHEFGVDGRWHWRAAPGRTAAITSRAGRWRVEGDELVLSVESEQDAPRDPPLEERLDLGECPPNDEARALDAAYACRSFGGRAFWRNAK